MMISGELNIFELVIIAFSTTQWNFVASICRLYLCIPAVVQEIIITTNPYRKNCQIVCSINNQIIKFQIS